MKRFLIGFLSLLTVGQMAVAALPAGAQTSTPCDPSKGDPLKCLDATGLGGTGQTAATAGQQLPILVGRIIRTLLGILGIIFVVLIVYAGFLWMTARGESDPVDKAKDIIKQSIIGLIIIMLAYAITGFVVNAVVKATTGTP